MQRYLKNGWLAAAFLASLILLLVGYFVGSGSLAGIQLAGAGGRGKTPLVGFQFLLKMDGNPVAYFTQIEGLGSETEVVEHKMVNDSGQEIIRTIAGRTRWMPVTLQRGVTQDQYLVEWREQVVSGDADGARKNVEIIMFDANMSEVAAWELQNAWPIALTFSHLDGSPGAIVEQVVLTYDSFYRSR